MRPFTPVPTENLQKPYVYYNAIRQFVERAEGWLGGLPNDVRPVLDTFNKSTAHHLRSALRSMELIDEHNVPSEKLRRLIAATGEERQRVFLGVLTDTYPFLLGPQADGFNAATASRAEIEARFKDAGVESESTAQRSTAFFLAAIKDAGLVREDTGQNGHAAKADSGASQRNTNGKSNPIQEPTPPLPPYEHGWPDDLKRMWFEQRGIEMKKKLEA